MIKELHKRKLYYKIFIYFCYKFISCIQTISRKNKIIKCLGDFIISKLYDERML